MQLIRLRQTGETIVEVLICMAIVSSTLALSYSTTRVSTRKVRQSEERGQSTQLAKQQLERFKQLLKLHPTMSTKSSAGSWILAPSLSENLTTSFLLKKADGSPIINPGFCIYKDMIHIHYTWRSDDAACAVNEKGAYYCEDKGYTLAAGGPQICWDYNLTASVFDSEANTAISLGYQSTAAVIYPTPLLGISSQEQDDTFFVSAGRYQVGGDGLNTHKYDVITIPYRIHQ